MDKPNQKTCIKIAGMHCAACELIIEEKIKELPNIKKVKISRHTNEAEITFCDCEPKPEIIAAKIKEAGYKVGVDGPVSLINRDKKIYGDLGLALLFLFCLFLVLKSTGLINYDLGFTEKATTLPLVLLVGLTAGFSTCMALVGGLILGISARFAENHPQATTKEKFHPHLFFTIGRLLSYLILGGVLGLIGSAFQLSSLTLGIVTLIIALIMLIMGLQLTEVFPWLNNFKISLPPKLAKILKINKTPKTYSNKGALITGALTFFLPCGFTQTMQLYAINSGNFVDGALIMGFFALGTIPGLLGIGAIASFAKGVFARRFFKFAGLLVIIFAIFNFINGWNLTTVNFDSSTKPKTTEIISTDPNVIIEDGVQIVKMTETNRGYSPNKFTIRRDLPVKWVIDAQAPNSCAAALIVPKLKIRSFLEAGENIIEFTPPADLNRLNFSCSMGMYTGYFNIIDFGDNSDSSSNKNSEAIAQIQSGNDLPTPSCHGGGVAITDGGSAPTGSCGCGDGSGGCGGRSGGCGSSGTCGGSNKASDDSGGCGCGGN